MKKLRLISTTSFIILFLIEILIAVFVHDSFIRPYIGDVLVTVLICCFMRIFIPKAVRALPVYVFIFSTLVEALQYFDVVRLLGLEDNALISTLIGRTFSFGDILCYGTGCICFYLYEKTVIDLLKRNGEQTDNA